MSLRRLLHVAMPLPDEPLDSWVEFMAHNYGATVGEMARALGLIGGKGVPDAGAQSSRAWSTELEPQQLRNLELTTGRAGDEYRAMTRTTFAANAIRLTPQGRISASCPATGVAARYCPECLAEVGNGSRETWVRRSERLPGMSTWQLRTVCPLRCSICGPLSRSPIRCGR